MDTLAMYHVPPAALSNHRGDLRSKVVVPLARPSRDAKDVDALKYLLTGTFTSPIGRKNCDIEVIKDGKPTSYLVNVRLDTA
jgi:hypothetical protein